MAKGKFKMLKNVPKGLIRSLNQANKGLNSDGTHSRGK